MKNLVLLALFFIFSFFAKADSFIYKGDTSYFYTASPLGQHPQIAEIMLELKGYASEPCFHCYNLPYNAEWTVIDDQLYLSGIYSAGTSNPPLKADINKLFNVSTGKVKADWVTTDIWLPKGKIIGMIENQYFNSAELHVTILKGKITKTKTFNYPFAREMEYVRTPELITSFIYNNINWSKIPVLDSNKLKVVASFESGAWGKPANIKIMRGAGENSIYNKEVLRVISLLQWNIYYRHGQVYKHSWGVPIIFSEENRRKYAR